VVIVLIVAAVVVLAAAAFVAVQAHRFGGVKAAFRGDLKEQRQALAAGRSRVSTLRKAREAELRDARKGDEQARAAYDKRIADLQQRAAMLENPGAGAKIGGLKDVKLYEHAVQVSGRMIALYGAQARVEITSDSALLYVTAADGSSVFRAFDTRFRDVGDPTVKHGSEVVTVSQKQKRDFAPEQIHGLATAINNAAVAEQRFVAELPAMRAATAWDLEQAVADTGAV
jgi:hypothetical protein